MTRAEAIKCIQEDGIRLGAGDFVDVEALKVAVACMQEQERNKWISVKDRLPADKKDEYVLVVCDYHGKISVETRKKWNLDSSVTHWMPFPTPPKEDAE